MKKIYPYLFVLFFVASANKLKAQVYVNDSLALVDLYNSTNGKQWTHNYHWLTSKPVSTWYGVTLLADRVFYLVLPSNNLKGVLPSSFSSLDLRYLDLSFNKLSGNIPAWSNNVHFDSLNLSNNNFSGNIPDTLNGSLNLSFNQLTGSIPRTLAGYKLNLSHNKLTGEIPGSILALQFLIALDLSYNKLTGKISNCKQLYNIQSIYLNDNKLSGAIPPSLFTRGSLTELHLENNNLSDTLPNFGGAGFKVLSLFHNQLTGTVPSSISKVANLVRLNISANRFSGTLPSSLTKLKALTHLNVVYNHFTFDGMETLVQHNYKQFIYSNEKEIDVHQNGNTLSVYAGGTLSNNTYNWYNNGNLVATIVGDSTYTPIASGNYSVAVANSIATELTLYSDTIAVSTSPQSSSITANQLNKNEFSVYPNPARSIVNISFVESGKCAIKLTDVSGRVLQTQTMDADKKQNNIQLDVSKYAHGIYFVTLYNEKKQTQTLQLIKQ
jgi:Leucine-rich repeat (LRR) protein